MGADGLPAHKDEDAARESREAAAIEPPSSSGRARLWITLSALIFYGLFLLRTSFTIGGTRYFVLFEDAMISMRYGRHVADGHGFVWNIGEPPIEGFTNLLWVLWMSVAHMLGLTESKISLFIMLTGVAVMIATGLVTSRIAKHLSDAPWVPVAVLAATLFDYPLVFWTLRGMEVGALALFVYTLLWLALENEEKFSLPRTVAMAVVTVAALLIRSDSVVAVGLICLYAFLFAEAANRWIFAAVIGVFAGAAVGGQTLLRRHTFHETLPNTYFLKLYHISFLARVKRGAFVALEVLAVHLAVPISVVLASLPGLDRLDRAFWKDKKKRRLTLLGAIFVMQIAYATYVGGDAWEWMLYANRYTCIGMPALIVLVAVATAHVAAASAEDRAAFVKKLSVALVGFGVLLVMLNLFAKKFPEHGIAATITFSKKAFAVGAGLAGLGVLLRLRDLRDGVPEALASLQRRFGSRRTVTAAALLVTAIVWLPSHLLPVGQWLTQNAAQFKDEANYTRLGILIRESTPDKLRLAVAAAGATPYFAQRPTEDLLGKNDAHIAKLAPKGVFSPGHDKWDYEWSLGERHADLIVETVDVTPADEAYIASLGFEKLPNGMLLRSGSVPDKEREIVGREMPDGAALAAALADEGKALPPATNGVDYAMIFAFALVIALLARRVVRDEEPFADLTRDPPASGTSASDEEVVRSLAGADARAIPTLDGMRGIAVILVLLFHFAWTFPGEDPAAAHGILEKLVVQVHAFLWSGWIGVDLFFVLSGYLITRGLVAPSTGALGTRMKKFWMRRVLRIFPLYYAVTIVGTGVALAAAGYVPGAPYWLYMQNYALAFDPPDQALKWVAHFWSLAIEEQFYFVWPIVALTVPRRRLIPLILGLVGFVVFIRVGVLFKGMSVGPLAAFFKDDDYIRKFVYRATFTRADGLLLGAFVAVTQREALHPVAKIWRRLRFPLFVSTAVALAGLYVIANGLNDYDRRVMAIGYFAMALLFASAVSMCADTGIPERARRFLTFRPLVACGKVSYGMYIFHWPLVVVLVPWLEKVQQGMPLGTQIGLCTAVILGGTLFIYGIAEVSFRFFEQRFLSLKVKFHD
jgi:peptidoglycan/LPS O-acetylase OafA/YrhL